MKICSKCKIEKELSEFDKQKHGKLGLASQCKSCKQQYDKDFKEKYPERVRDRSRRYESKNKEKVKVKNRRVKANQRINNPDAIKTNRSVYYKNNIKKILAGNRTYVNKRKKIDINFKLTLNLRARLNIAIRSKQKAGSAIKDLGCSVDEFKIHLEKQWKPGMSWNNYGIKLGQWSIDHVYPLSRFDLTDRKQLLKACNYANLQPMWHLDNMKKGNKVT